MEPVKLEGMNRKLQPPPNWNEAEQGECGELWVFAQAAAGVGVQMTSAWQPNAEELAALARGCPVALTVFGSVIPPMAVGVFDYDPKEAETPEQRQTRLENNLRDAASALQAHMRAGAFVVPGAGTMAVYVGEPERVVALANGHAMRKAAERRDEATGASHEEPSD